MSGTWRRTGAGTLRSGDAGDTIRIAGWVSHRRDHGGLIFVDVRDETGVVQAVVDPVHPEALAEAERLRHEWVIEAIGTLAIRPEGSENDELATGDVELQVETLVVLAESENPPFVIDDRIEVDEALRLRFRYLDLRRPKMLRILKHRAAAIMAIRTAMTDSGLLEVETPALTRATPEGARDYLVPSRVSPGHGYALAQSPQLYKQLLMVAGVGGYFQVARCWRDEDLRADRQPEFTQLDVEVAFANVDEVIGLIEEAVCAAFQAVRGESPDRPFARLTWAEAMAKYGTDKPDLRISGTICDVGDVFAKTGFKAFASALDSGASILGIRSRYVPANPSRSFLDGLVLRAQEAGAKGLVWVYVEEDGALRSPVAKFLDDDELRAVAVRLEGTPGDLLLFVADEVSVGREVLGRLRSELAEPAIASGEIDPYDFRPCWITDFPLAEWNAGEGRLDPLHHPFCAPHPDDLAILERGETAIMEAGPENVRAQAYDLVLNGWELGSGSVRIHSRELQEKTFKAIGLDYASSEEKFGFLLDAFSFGAPPHAGFAVGLDRLIALLVGETSIREVIAFPKTQTAHEPMTGAPAPIEPEQLKLLGLSPKRNGGSGA